MNGRRAAIVVIGAEVAMAASFALSGVIGWHGQASASPAVSAVTAESQEGTR